MNDLVTMDKGIIAQTAMAFMQETKGNNLEINNE